MSFTSVLILLALVSVVFAVLVNRTIDDQFGDPITGIMPTYYPAANWTQITDCSGCWAKPDRTLLFNGTCHDSTYFPGVGDQTPHTITFTFNGSAIYIFFVTLPQIHNGAVETHLNVTLDGQAAGVYDFVPSPSDSYRYNVSVYSNPNLLAGLHYIVISSAVISNVMEFDYAVYSIEDGTQPSSSQSSSSQPSSSQPSSSQPPSSQHKISAGAIVGGVVGGLVVVSTLSLLLFFRQRHNSRGSVLAPIITNRDGVVEGPGGDHEVFNLSLLSGLESKTQPGMLEHASMSHIPSPTEDIHDTADLRAHLESLRAEVELLKQARYSQQSLLEERAPSYASIGD